MVVWLMAVTDDLQCDLKAVALVPRHSERDEDALSSVDDSEYGW